LKDSLGRTGRRLGVAARPLAACFMVAALSGCGPASPSLDPQTGKELQTRVLAVSTAAASADPATGLRTLDELADHVTRAAADGKVSFKRHQSIVKAIEAVRADLRAAIAAKAAASKAAAEKAAASQAASQAEAGKAAAETTEAAPAQNFPVHPSPLTVAPLPSSPPAPGDEDGDKGPGKGSDNGPGKGKGKEG
jgi:hypothetical protein